MLEAGVGQILKKKEICVSNNALQAICNADQKYKNKMKRK